MIDLNLTLASSGAVKTSGYDNRLHLGYSRNRGVYRLVVAPTGEWEGLTIRAIWRTGRGTLLTCLVQDGMAEVPALITCEPGEGRLTFEGSDGTRTMSSADIRYSVAANSGGNPDDMPEPGTPAWEAFIRAMREQTGGIATTEKQMILAVLRAVADNVTAQDAYNALAALWDGKRLDSTAAVLGHAILGRMTLNVGG